jgi:hypothetical protein
MTDSMMFPMKWEGFLKDYSFIDHKEFYTNGARLIPTFRVEQMVEHYFAKDTNVPSWIPVSERLPDHEDAVLCFIKNGQQEILQLDKFENLWVGMQWTYKRHAVTHWVPLPEPPESK